LAFKFQIWSKINPPLLDLALDETFPPFLELEPNKPPSRSHSQAWLCARAVAGRAPSPPAVPACRRPCPRVRRGLRLPLPPKVTRG